MRENLVIVGGCGHVGLPLGIMFAARGGMHVTLLDIDRHKVDIINGGRMPFLETGAEQLLKEVAGKDLEATTDPTCLKSADAVITVIGTPIDRHLNPTVHALYSALESLLEYMPDHALLVLRSTVFPGVTKLIQDRIQMRGRKVQVAFCPERIAEGRAVEELTFLPQIISAFEPEALEKAHKLFSRITPKIVALSPLEAELAKLFTNGWRYLNFAISNQFYVLAQSYGVDFYRIHDAVTQDYPRMRAFAGAGFTGGPCLLKDTMQLAAFSGNNFFMGHAAMLINEGLPNFIVSQLRNSDLSGRTVAILGMAFKADSDDARDSLAFKLKKLLELEPCKVLCTDPYIADPDFVPLEDALRRADIFILGAPHSAYKDLELPAGKLAIDIWRFWPDRKSALTPKPETPTAKRQ
jgi:UDP-N-acetyl-D-mannosaminuronic acid dehydrogenase